MNYQFNSVKKITISLITLIFISNCRPVDPSEKAFYKLSESEPYRFEKGGVVETWDQGEEYWDKSCRTKGRWKMEGKIIVVEGIFNSNCSWMSRRNGRFKLNGENLERQ